MGKRGRFPETTIASLPSKIEQWSIPKPNSGCWLWLSTVLPKGYGNLTVGGKVLRAHRASWLGHRGAIPNGAHVLHSCDTPACVNPDHLFLGTNYDNVQDRVRKNRGGAVYGNRQHLSKLTADQAVAIYSSQESRHTLATRYGVSRQAITAIRQHKSWAWLTRGQKND